MSETSVKIQQWIESLPPPEKNERTTSQIIPAPVLHNMRQSKKFIPRDMSLQSDDASSHCSSVESVLELRKPDPEAILMSLGFGPSKSSSLLSKIPQRFLKPSKLITDIDLEKFLEQYGESPFDSTNKNPQSTFSHRP